MEQSSKLPVVHEADNREESPSPGKRPSLSFSTAADQVLQMSSVDSEGLKEVMRETEDLEDAIMEVEDSTICCSRWDEDDNA